MKRLFSMTEDALRTIELTDHGISILINFIKGIIILDNVRLIIMYS